MNRAVEIVEVSPRDGLQNEATALNVATKQELIKRAIAMGVKRVEVGSFVHPDYVPQMAGTEEVIIGLPDPDKSDVSYIGLVLNKRGVLRALDTKVTELGVVVVASNEFGLKNQGQTIQQSIDFAKEATAMAKSQGREAQITIAVSWHCPFEGPRDFSKVADMAETLASLEPKEIALADTIGMATPYKVKALCEAVLDRIGDIPLRLHMHDTRATALANIYAAYECGVRIFDTALGGLGGCPFAPGASGNMATEDLLYAFRGDGIKTGIDLEASLEHAGWITEQLNITGRSSLLSAQNDYIG